MKIVDSEEARVRKKLAGINQIIKNSIKKFKLFEDGNYQTKPNKSFKKVTKIHLN